MNLQIKDIVVSNRKGLSIDYLIETIFKPEIYRWYSLVKVQTWIELIGIIAAMKYTYLILADYYCIEHCVCLLSVDFIYASTFKQDIAQYICE